jgi:hypothetical protein
MMILRSLLVLGLALSLVGSTAEAAKGKKKKNNVRHGVVEVVSLDQDKDSGKITIKQRAKKKKGTEAKSEEIKLTKSTTVERVAGKKGNKTTETAKLSDLKAGEHVHILVKDGVAEDIKIVKAGKKSKKKAA